ncbi:hypothetical protein NE237_006182 [Protea cynaroides]|uniref:Uncharacterized protein n=1 Tax=Protea cynaroides TaxID=273540 RepID=A0A9Q0KLR4_9MAGN|nr:hypothetical protein NE237_005939 [Protea cynaroides]KAJ4973008.1 hypothetical protein NE237_006182 [Protea cynaroides]
MKKEEEEEERRRKDEYYQRASKRLPLKNHVAEKLASTHSLNYPYATIEGLQKTLTCPARSDPIIQVFIFLSNFRSQALCKRNIQPWIMKSEGQFDNLRILIGIGLPAKRGSDWDITVDRN